MSHTQHPLDLLYYVSFQMLQPPNTPTQGPAHPPKAPHKPNDNSAAHSRNDDSAPKPKPQPKPSPCRSPNATQPLALPPTTTHTGGIPPLEFMPSVLELLCDLIQRAQAIPDAVQPVVLHALPNDPHASRLAPLIRLRHPNLHLGPIHGHAAISARSCLALAMPFHLSANERRAGWVEAINTHRPDIVYMVDPIDHDSDPDARSAPSYIPGKSSKFAMHPAKPVVDLHTLQKELSIEWWTGLGYATLLSTRLPHKSFFRRDRSGDASYSYATVFHILARITADPVVTQNPHPQMDITGLLPHKSGALPIDPIPTPKHSPVAYTNTLLHKYPSQPSMQTTTTMVDPPDHMNQRHNQGAYPSLYAATISSQMGGSAMATNPRHRCVEPEDLFHVSRKQPFRKQSGAHMAIRRVGVNYALHVYVRTQDGSIDFYDGRRDTWHSNVNMDQVQHAVDGEGFQIVHFNSPLSDLVIRQLAVYVTRTRRSVDRLKMPPSTTEAHTREVIRRFLRIKEQTPDADPAADLPPCDCSYKRLPKPATFHSLPNAAQRSLALMSQLNQAQAQYSIDAQNPALGHKIAATQVSPNQNPPFILVEPDIMKVEEVKPAPIQRCAPKSPALVKDVNEPLLMVHQPSPLTLSPVSSLPSSSSSPVNPTLPAFSAAFPETPETNKPVTPITAISAHSSNVGNHLKETCQTSALSSPPGFGVFSSKPVFLSGDSAVMSSSPGFPRAAESPMEDYPRRYGAHAGLFKGIEGVSKLEFSPIGPSHAGDRTHERHFEYAPHSDPTASVASLAGDISKAKKLAASSLGHSDYHDTQDQELIG